MRYVYAALIAAACLLPWVIYALHLRTCRRERTHAAIRAAICLAAARTLPPTSNPRPAPTHADLPAPLHRPHPDTLAALRQRRDEARAAVPEPGAVRPYVLDADRDAFHRERYGTWPDLDPDRDQRVEFGDPGCRHPGMDRVGVAHKGERWTWCGPCGRLLSHTYPSQ